MDRPQIKRGVDDRLLLAVAALVALLFAGCVDRGGEVVVPGRDETPVVEKLTSEREFLLALSRAVERGDFDDTDQFQVAMRRAAKNLGLDASKLGGPLNDAVGDLGETRPLTAKEQRAEFARKVKKAAETLK